MQKKITVLLVDDHSLVRRGFRRMLEDEPDMEVVGEAGDGEESVKLAKKLQPQVVVMDPKVEQKTTLRGERNSALTQRELEVLQMIVDGKSNKEIAIALELSANTVAVHRANIMNTLGIHKTAELVVYAIRAGLVNVP